MALIKVKERGRETVNLGRRNLIINGDMRIAQRSTAAVQAGNGTYDTVDRMMTWSIAGGGTFTGSQSTGHQLATGHNTAYKVDVTSADTSLASGDYYEFLQRIEARNIQHLRWGTASAQKLQVSFWVRATKTGVQSIFFSKQGTGTAYRNVINYTINATDTWEYKTLEVPALTASTIANDSATYLQVGFVLGMGSGFHVGTAGTWTTGSLYSTANSVNHMDSTSNDFYVTGLQIEAGDTVTDFEHRSFGEELALCQRYFYAWTSSGLSDNLYIKSPYASGTPPNTSASVVYTFPVTMRSNPTMTALTGSAVSNLNRFTSSIHNASVQHASTSSGGAISLDTWTAAAEL